MSTNRKLDALEEHRVRPTDGPMTTDQRIVTHTDDSLKAGPRGSSLLEDFHLREKIVVTDGARAGDIRAVQEPLLAAGAFADLVSETMGPLLLDDGSTSDPRYTLLTVASVQFDAVYVAGGAPSVARLSRISVAERFLRDTWRHCTPLAFSGEAIDLWTALEARQTWTDRPGVGVDDPELGVILVTTADASFAAAFEAAIKRHRFWGRQRSATVPVPRTLVRATAEAWITRPGRPWSRTASGAGGRRLVPVEPVEREGRSGMQAWVSLDEAFPVDDPRLPHAEPPHHGT
jgi:hypothetical protein